MSDQDEALAAVGYHEREVYAAAESVAGAHRKLERAEQDLADAQVGIGTAEAEQAAAQARLENARTVAAPYVDGSMVGAQTGIAAGDPAIEIQEN